MFVFVHTDGPSVEEIQGGQVPHGRGHYDVGEVGPGEGDSGEAADFGLGGPEPGQVGPGGEDAGLEQPHGEAEQEQGHHPQIASDRCDQIEQRGYQHNQKQCLFAPQQRGYCPIWQSAQEVAVVERAQNALLLPV